MKRGESSRSFSLGRGGRRGGGLVRTLVVASATLAILFVCFTIYQYSQIAPAGSEAPNFAREPRPRVPMHRTRSFSERRTGGLPVPSHSSPLAGNKQGVSIGPATIGQGRKIKLSVFPREGTRARLEIAVRDYTPIEDSPSEFFLSEPEIRMRTNDGRTVRITADEGVLDAQRQGVGGLDPRRGRLRGDVVIEIDRLTESEWAAVSPEDRARIEQDRSNIMTVEVEEIEFDLEYARVIVPRGSLRLIAHDIEFEAEDLEIRFNEEQGRMEYLRIDHGGRFVFREHNDELRLVIPSTDVQPEKRTSIVNWMRSALEAVLRAPPAISEDAEEGTNETETVTDETPVFHPDSDENEKVKPPVRYFARFQGNVDTQQTIDDVVQARMHSDVMEIIRVFTQEDKTRARGRRPGQKSDDRNRQAGGPKEEIVLSWTGKLVLEALTPSHDRWTEEEVSRVTATGAPVRISSPQWRARCSELAFDPNRSHVWLTGSKDNPVVIRSPTQGVMTGVTVFTKRTDDKLYMRVDGPGTMYRSVGTDGETETIVTATLDDARSVVHFSEQMEINGRFATKTTFDFSGGISTREYRVIERADFRGDVRMVEGETGLSAQEVTLLFDNRKVWRNDEPAIRRINGKGDVVMTRGRDRVSCGEIDILLTTDVDGRTIPLSTTAMDNVEAMQGERAIRARDKLTIEFEMVTKPPPPFDPVRARAKAIETGLDPASIDWSEMRRAHESTARTEVGVKRMVVDGDVVIVDPTDGLDVRARHVDCHLTNGREITRALVVGSEDRPASAKLRNFTVTGAEIQLNVPDEWAVVPGAGRMTFSSYKDLDGGRIDKPIPISVTWRERMKYQGRENRAVFLGDVHATSASSTTFDCERLVIDFENVAKVPARQPSTQYWLIFDNLFDKLAGGNEDNSLSLSRDSFSKEPVHILATGKARVETSIFNKVTGERESRALLVGPRLSANLKPEVSKMLIEGPGKLLLEDFRPARELDDTSSSQGQDHDGLFSLDGNSGPSKTLIAWEEFMWYDFSIDQTRFEGDVSLKHFSGAVLDKYFGTKKTGSTTMPPGRETYLTCDVLTVDFLDRSARRREPNNRRMGGLSSDRLRQFQATGSVELQDETESLSLLAERVVFERDRQILAIFGSPTQRARIYQYRKGRTRGMIQVERAFYNIATGELEVFNAAGWGR